MPEVHRAPDCPGLYAWYGRAAPGPPDVADAESVRRYIGQHTRRFITPTLTLKARSTFRRSWEGTLLETTSVAFDKYLGLSGEIVLEEAGGEDSAEPNQDFDTDTDPAELKGCVNAVLAEERLRDVLIESLNNAIPLLTSPLYVGIAKEQTLRTRLTQHYDKFGRVKKSHPTSDDRQRLLEDLQSKGKSSFAAQAVAAGFTEDALEVHCLPLPESLNDDTGRKLLPAVEYLLNRWHYPPFGRR